MVTGYAGRAEAEPMDLYTTQWAVDNLPDGTELVRVEGRWWLIVWGEHVIAERVKCKKCRGRFVFRDERITMNASPDPDEWMPKECFSAVIEYEPSENIGELLAGLDRPGEEGELACVD